MKISGSIIGKPKPKVVVITRDNKEFVFKVGPVTDWSNFEKLCPDPPMSYITRPGEEPVPNLEDPKYVEALRQNLSRRVGYMFIMSLADYTEGIEFEVVDIADPTTWDKLGEEFDASGLNSAEASAILNAIKEVNGLSPELIEEATKSFMLRQALQAQ